MCLSGVFTLTCLLANLYFLQKTSKPWGRHPFQDKVNQIAKIETYILLLSGIIMYSFPDFAILNLEQTNESYQSICRSCGALMASMAFESFCMSEFSFLKDKKMFMASRFCVSVFYLLFFLK